jgi:putative MATE family efflux protein
VGESSYKRLIDSDKKPAAVIWMLAWPAIIDQLFHTAVQYVDSAMVGSLGAVATAAVAANTSTIWLVNGTMYAIGTGFSVIAARNIGAGDYDVVKRVVHQAVLTVVALGIVVSTLLFAIGRKLPLWIGVEAQVVPDAQTYIRWIALSLPFTIAFMFFSNLLRSSGDTKSPMICNIVVNLSNVIGNFLLIFPTRIISIGELQWTMWGAGMGVRGAAISTAFANMLAGLIMTGIIVMKRTPVQISRSGSWKPDKPILGQVFRLATPLALERAMLSFGQITLTVIVTGIGTTALAAHHLAITAESITYMPVNGFSIAATTLVAQSLGAHRQDKARSFAVRCLLYGILLMSFTGFLMFVFSRQLMGFFTGDLGVIELGSRVLRIEAFAEPFFAMAIVGSGILRGSGDTRRPFAYSLIGMWIVRLLPAAILIFVFDLGLEAAWSCMVADLCIRGLLNLRRVMKNRWLTTSQVQSPQ